MPARLRRHSTRLQPYSAGMDVSIVRVPQLLAGVDVGHISVLVTNHDSTVASVGFYSKRYRQGLPLITRDEAILVSPDPLYVRAHNNPVLREQIAELWRGQLSVHQAESLNEWTTDHDGGPLELTHFTTSAGQERELAVSQLKGEHYAGMAALIPGSENCATWVQRAFPDKIACPFGLPRFCTSVAPLPVATSPSNAGARPSSMKPP